MQSFVFNRYLLTELCLCSVADVFKYMDGETNNRKVPPPVDILQRLSHKEILRQSAEGVAFLHDLGYVHRNLHPDNFLISSDFVIKLTDFDCAKSWHHHPEFTGTVGGWSVPEDDDGDDPTKRDVFILGCYFYYVLTGGEYPFGQGVHLRKIEMQKSDHLMYSESKADINKVMKSLENAKTSPFGLIPNKVFTIYFLLNK